ncbi:MAG TPA: hypothetical protein IAA36_04445 [Candidatus Eubacterium pullicola]|nr:hypothetical protein [Candidatus Eubacterium pullicola]
MSDVKKELIDETSTQEQNAEVVPETPKGFLAWVKAHKTQLILVGISIPTIVAVVLGLKNKDAIKVLWDQLNEEIKKANMYTSKWFESLTDEALSTEREKVRLAYCSSEDNFSEASRLQNLLWRFDKEMSKRAWGDEIPHAPSIHREHGWYLPNDD